MHYGKGSDTAFDKYDVSKVFYRWWRQKHIRKGVLVEADCCQLEVFEIISFFLHITTRWHREWKLICCWLSVNRISWRENLLKWLLLVQLPGWHAWIWASWRMSRWTLLSFLAEHDVLVWIFETFVEAFYLESDLFIDKIEIGSSTVIELSKEAILLLYSP